MITLFCLLLILIQACLGVLMVFLLLEGTALEPGLLSMWGYIAGWVLVCLMGYWWTPGLSLAFLRVRKTILEEEVWLNPLLDELNERSKMRKVPRLLILEHPTPTAFATGRQTVVMSRGLIVLLSKEELRAVLAHEYGHLRHWDTRLIAAYSLAAYKPGLICGILGKLMSGMLRFIKRMPIPVSLLLFIPGLLILFLVLPQQGILLIRVVLILLLYPVLRNIMDMLWMYCCRIQEYRQDEFAQSLGYGRELKSALMKLNQVFSDEPIQRAINLLQMHPIIYNRVRRLERLEGMREGP